MAVNEGPRPDPAAPGLSGGRCGPVAPPPPATLTLNTVSLNAWTVFRKEARLLKSFHFGFSTVNLDEQITFYRGLLEGACAPQPTTCPVRSGDKALKELLYRSVNDRHPYAMTAAEFQARVKRFEAARQKVSTFGLTLGSTGWGAAGG